MTRAEKAASSPSRMNLLMFERMDREYRRTRWHNAERQKQIVVADLHWLSEQVGIDSSDDPPFENDTFVMHPYCWCGRDDCPWCWGCTCPPEADIYEVRGRPVGFREWTSGYRHVVEPVRSYRHNPELICDYCRGERKIAANFLHKPSGTEVHWYKHIGRGMVIDLHGDWPDVMSDCIASLIDKERASGAARWPLTP